MVWHSERKEDVAEELQTQPKIGLSDMTVNVRLKEYGGNVREVMRKRSRFAAFTGKLLAPLSFTLTALSVTWMVLDVVSDLGAGRNPLTERNWLCPAVMLAAVILLAAVRAARELAAADTAIRMMRNSSARSKVRRGSVIKEVPSEELVPGDIVQIEVGDMIPADGRLLITSTFACDESALTGQEGFVYKDSDAVLDWETPVEGRINMVYAGTAAVSGRALMLVTETGMNTEAALREARHRRKKAKKSKGLKQYRKPKKQRKDKHIRRLRKLKLQTPMVRDAFHLRAFAIWATLCVSLSVGTVFALRVSPSSLPHSFDEVLRFLTERVNGADSGYLYAMYLLGQYPYDPSFLNEVYEWLGFIVLLAICAVPLGLPQNVMHSIAEGMKSLRRHKTELHDFHKAERIGCTTVICTDKTGTLTLGDMTVAKAWPLGDTPAVVSEGFWSDEMRYLMKCSALCCDSELLYDYEGRPVVTGDMTEAAILSAYTENGGNMRELREQYPRCASIPFDSNRKLMTVIHEIDGLYMVVTKGAPDVLAARCINADTDEIDARVGEMGSEGLRVIAVAVQVLHKLPDEISPETIENDMLFIGLIGLDDPCREDVAKSVRECAAAGIRTVMLTGDHPETAAVIARRIGILDDGGAVLTGEELADMPDKRLRAMIPKYSVFARISPEDKIRLVKIWQSRGECVLMAAGGMGDAPALRTADISCAMQETAADVAVSAADITISGNRYVDIRRLVKMGRAIRQNLAKLSEFSMTCCVAQSMILFGGKLLFRVNFFRMLPLILLNLLLFIFIQPFFADEPAESDTMRCMPQPDDGRLMGTFEKTRALLAGGFIAFNSLLMYWLAGDKLLLSGYPINRSGASTAFVFLSMSLVLYALCARSNRPFIITSVVRNRGLLFGSLAVVSTVLFMTMYQAAARVLGLDTAFLLQIREMAFLLGLELFVWQYPKCYGYVSCRK